MPNGERRTAQRHPVSASPGPQRTAATREGRCRLGLRFDLGRPDRLDLADCPGEEASR